MRTPEAGVPPAPGMARRRARGLPVRARLRKTLRLLAVAAPVLLAALALGVAFLLAGRTPHAGPLPNVTAAASTAAAGAPPSAAPPRPEPLVFDAISTQDARAINARTPFAADFGGVAPAFRLRGTVPDMARAVDCLAAAMWYEAGGSDLGQRAVAQVVLNRVRHPAFPASVCGVVFQGAERRTGCQFTFTCDGALARRPPESAIALARARAEQMLHGYTVPQVGLATHYHTDWVHPLWSSEMDKLARIDTHLFFRWAGAWGRGAALRQPYAAQEPTIARLAWLSPMHRPGADVTEEAAALALQGADASARPTGLATNDAAKGSTGPLTIVMLPGGDGGRQSFQALGKCSGKPACKVFGYVEGNMADVAFVYVRDRRSEWVEVMLWNCAVFPRAKADECLGSANRKWLDYAA